MSLERLPLATPSRSSRMTIRHRIQTVRFGGGRAVRIRDGHTAAEVVWRVVWNGLSVAEATEIDDFLHARKGVEGFLWVPPEAATAQVFICLEWQVTPIAPGFSRIDAQLIRQS